MDNGSHQSPLSYFGQFNPPVDKFIFENWPYLAQNTESLIIEAGAADGITESSTYFFEKYFGRICVNVEADPVWYSKLVQNRKSSINLNFALDENVGTKVFTRVLHPVLGESYGHGSLKHTHYHRRYLKKNNCSFSRIEVSTIDLTGLFEMVDAHSVDLLVLDVEGNEKQVLQGLKKLDSDLLPRILCVETDKLNEFFLKHYLMKFNYTFFAKSFVNSFFIQRKRYL